MKTYSTYQEARIANPECEIYKWDEMFTSSSISPMGHSLQHCNPADYCMTVKEFLECGYKFEDGDLILTCKNNVAMLGLDGYTCVNFNIKHQNNDKTYILRAAALDLAAIAKQNVEHYLKQISDTARGAFSTDSIPKIHKDSEFYKKPRTKVEFVKVDDSIWNLEDDFKCGDLYNKSLDCSGEFVVIKSETVLLACAAAENLYRRVETKMTEREALAEALKEIWIIDGVDGEMQIERIVNSGLFKLVN